MNPYYGKNFLGFYLTLMQRIWGFITGQIPLADLASDEIQMLVLALVGISSVVVGLFMVLRKTTMMANSLSHTILLGIIIAYLITKPFLKEAQMINIQTFLLAALFTGLLTSLLTEVLIKVLKLQEDASIGLVFTTLFALGVTLVTLYTKNLHIGTEAIMGNVDALHIDDLKLALSLLLLNLTLLFLFYKRLVVSSFDANFSRNLGMPLYLMSILLILQTSATAIGAFRAVGVFLFLALLVGPVLAARLVTHRIGRILALASAFSLLSALIAVGLSRHLLSVHGMAISTSGMVVVVIGGIFICCAAKKILSPHARRA